MRASILFRLLVLLLIVIAAVPLATAAQGTSEGAKACQKGGYMDYTGLAREGDQIVPVTFKNAGDCVSYVARGGTLVPLLVGGGETMIWARTLVYRVDLIVTYTSPPPTQLNVCGFSAIPNAVAGNPDIGEYTGKARLYLESTWFSQDVWLTADCVTIYPQPGGNSFPSGSYRLEILTAPDYEVTPPNYQVVDFASFSLP
jgi:hypothetical protein